MATYKSPAYRKNAVYRPTSQVDPEEATFTISFPAGTNPVNGDVLKFCRLGENVRICQFQLELDQFDSNATAALAGKLGITGSDASLIAAATVLQTNTSGAKNFARVDGEATANDSFAVTPFPVSTSVTDVLLTISANAGTAFTTGIRNITLKIKYQYAYPDTYVTGVSATNYPFSGSKNTELSATYDYNGNAP